MEINTTLQIAIRFTVLLAPFFALSMFLCLTRSYTEKRRRRESIKIMGTSFILCVALIFFGESLFSLLGVSLSAFRVGVGVVLLLDAITLVRGKIMSPSQDDSIEEIAIVPMTIPVIVGPAVIGTMIVVGTDADTLEKKLMNVIAMGIACFVIWILLYLGTTVENYLGKKVLNILSKITGIYLAALAAQMILQGCKTELFN